MNFEVKQQILQKIKDYDRIFLFRHVRNDGDCVGASKGFKEILKLAWAVTLSLTVTVWAVPLE